MGMPLSFGLLDRRGSEALLKAYRHLIFGFLVLLN